MPAAAIDYDILARQHGGLPLIDYESLAREHGGEPLDSRPVHHSSNDVEELRSSAERQAPKIGDAVAKAVGSVPGAKLEAVRDSKDSDRIEDKAARQEVQPSQIADVLAAKVTVPHQEAADQVLKNLHKEMPVEKAEGSVTGEPQKNAVRQVQAIVDTKVPASEAVKKAEVLIQTPEMHKATEATHDQYRRAQELRAAGKDAEAAKLEQEIAAEHETAEQESRQGESNVQSAKATGKEENRPAIRPSGKDPIENAAPSSEASGQEKEKGSAGGLSRSSTAQPQLERKPGQAPIPLQRTSANEHSQVQEVAAAGAPVPPKAAEEVASKNQGAGLSRQAGAAPIPPTKLRELQAKLSTSVTPEENLKGQRIEVKDAKTGDWKQGTVLADSSTGGPDRLRRLRGSFDDGTKFDNVKLGDVRKQSVSARPDVAVDFDGTLAKETFSDKLGAPLPERINSIKKMLADGQSVVIFTRRVEHDPSGETAKRIQDWLEKNGLPRLPVTDVKEAKAFYDNNAHHAPTDANTPLIKSNNARKQ